MKGGDLLERTDPLSTRPDRRGRDRCPLQPLAEGPRSITKLPAAFYLIAAGILHKKMMIPLTGIIIFWLPFFK
ncbi:hypothetical protein [Enterococcus gilvus]|uniref:hypothetical protein n=1 Tax=Enterococcus gilvus TaxID=160453 RepID=UPI003D6A1729